MARCQGHSLSNGQRHSHPVWLCYCVTQSYCVTVLLDDTVTLPQSHTVNIHITSYCVKVTLCETATLSARVRISYFSTLWQRQTKISLSDKFKQSQCNEQGETPLWHFDTITLYACVLYTTLYDHYGTVTLIIIIGHWKVCNLPYIRVYRAGSSSS